MSYSSEIIEQIRQIYAELEQQQKDWYSKTKFTCVSGCGSCCHNFEPDLLISEAFFMADWLITNKSEVAQALADGTFRNDYKDKTCIFFDPDSDYHCTIYGGRAFICRLFGASSFLDKNASPVWRPCKFYPQDALSKRNPLLSHKQYTKEQTENILGSCPPVMSDIMERAVSLMPDNTSTMPLREILPLAVKQILFLRNLEKSDSVQ